MAIKIYRKTAYGPTLTRDGLILYLDALNTKSFKGEDTTNLVTNASTMTGWTNYYRTIASSTFTTEFGTTGYRFSTQPSWNGIYRNFNLVNSGTYTFSAWFKYIGGSSANNGATVYLSSYGSGDTFVAINKNLVGVWQRISLTVNVTSPTNVYLNLISFGGTDNGTTNPDYSSWEVTMPQIEAKAYATTFVNGTRGTTVATGGGFADLTRNAYHGELINGVRESTIGRSSLLFDGTDDYVAVSSPSNRWDWTPSGPGLNTMTIDLWVKTTDTSGDVVSKPWNGSGEYNYRIYAGGTLVLNSGGGNNYQSFSSYATGNWENITCIFTPTQMGVYRNGVVSAALANHGITGNVPVYGNAALPLTLMTLYPYGGAFNAPTHATTGNLALLRVYNRALSAAEILANYNASRSRFT